MNSMQEEKYQKELFEFEKPRKSFPKFDNIIPRNDYAVTLTAEKIIFVAIAVILLLVVVYALGVERGKTVLAKPAEYAVARPAAPKAAVEVSGPQKTLTNNMVQGKMSGTITKKAPEDIAVVKKPEAKAAVSIPKNTAIVQNESEISKKNEKPYTIIVVTFSRKDWAINELARLKKNGYDGFITQGNSYSQVCVGAFASKDSAKAALSKLKKLYKDAYVKLR